jgi:hypothetical protein
MGAVTSRISTMRMDALCGIGDVSGAPNLAKRAVFIILKDLARAWRAPIHWRGGSCQSPYGANDNKHHRELKRAHILS